MKISYSQLNQCSNELNSSFDNVNEILSNVSSIKEKITSSECWSGIAADYYVDELRNLSGNFDEVFSELKKTVMYLNKVLEGYQSVDVKVTRASGGAGNKNIYNTLN